MTTINENEINWIENGEKANSTNINRPLKEVLAKLNSSIFGENSVTEIQIANNSVTENKIANNSVTENKIANNSITENKIVDNSVTENKIANNSVTTDKIANDSVTTDKIANDSVTIDKLANDVTDLIDSKVAKTTMISTNNGLTGGGDLSTDRTIGISGLDDVNGLTTKYLSQKGTWETPVSSLQGLEKYTTPGTYSVTILPGETKRFILVGGGGGGGYGGVSSDSPAGLTGSGASGSATVINGIAGAYAFGGNGGTGYREAGGGLYGLPGGHGGGSTSHTQPSYLFSYSSGGGGGGAAVSIVNGEPLTGIGGAGGKGMNNGSNVSGGSGVNKNGTVIAAGMGSGGKGGNSWGHYDDVPPYELASPSSNDSFYGGQGGNNIKTVPVYVSDSNIGSNSAFVRYHGAGGNGGGRFGGKGYSSFVRCGGGGGGGVVEYDGLSVAMFGGNGGTMVAVSPSQSIADLVSYMDGSTGGGGGGGGESYVAGSPGGGGSGEVLGLEYKNTTTEPIITSVIVGSGGVGGYSHVGSAGNYYRAGNGGHGMVIWWTHSME